MTEQLTLFIIWTLMYVPCE